MNRLLMKLHISSVLFAFSLLFVFFYPSKIEAAAGSCVPFGVGYVGAPPAGEYNEPTTSVSFTLEGLSPNSPFSLDVTSAVCTPLDRELNTSGCRGTTIGGSTSDASGKATFNLPNGTIFPGGSSPPIGLAIWLTGPSIETGGCKLHSPYHLRSGVACGTNSIVVTQNRSGNSCGFKQDLAGSCLQTPNAANNVGPVLVYLQDIREAGQLYTGELQINVPGYGQESVNVRNGRSQSRSLELPVGNFRIIAEKPGSALNLCEMSITVSADCQALCLDPNQIDQAENLGPDKFSLCKQINDPTAQQKCLQCAGGEDGTEGIWTAVGCISKEPEEILGRFIRLGISMGGGVALLMILSAGFTMTISQGNAQKTAQAKEMMTAAITGLLFIIFSVTILQFIGFSILKIPGFGG